MRDNGAIMRHAREGKPCRKDDNVWTFGKKDEKTGYDALTQPDMVREAYSDEQFVALTKELTEELRKNRTIDWNRRESARAQMRTMVKRLLRKYKYPPEGQEQALEVVMEQCNQWADQEYYDGNAE